MTKLQFVIATICLCALGLTIMEASAQRRTCTATCAGESCTVVCH